MSKRGERIVIAMMVLALIGFSISGTEHAAQHHGWWAFIYGIGMGAYVSLLLWIFYGDRV